MLSRGIILTRVIALSAMLAVPAIAACSTPTTYAGIDLTASGADPQLQALASRARAGSKQAQLELGIRFKEGDGVPVDLDLAKVFYRSAAADDGGRVSVYSLLVGTQQMPKIALGLGLK